MNDYFDLIIRGIEKEIEPLHEAITNGSCQDFSEYRECLNKVQGLELASGVVKEYRTKYYRNED